MRLLKVGPIVAELRDDGTWKCNAPTMERILNLQAKLTPNPEPAGEHLSRIFQAAVDVLEPDEVVRPPEYSSYWPDGSPIIF